MRRQFQRQLKNLGLELIMMTSMVEEAVHNSIKSLQKNNRQLAEQVIEQDGRLDESEEKIEQKSISLLALQQPVANDLRRINAIIKIASELERIGDLALNISYISRELAESHPNYLLPYRISQMANLVQNNLRNVLSAYIEKDVELAKQVADKDQKIDLLDSQLGVELTQQIFQKETGVELIRHWLFVSRYLERMGDHITNICEWIIYLQDGKRVSY